MEKKTFRNNFEIPSYTLNILNESNIKIFFTFLPNI